VRLKVLEVEYCWVAPNWIRTPVIKDEELWDVFSPEFGFNFIFI
jgi:hypothetical protein